MSWLRSETRPTDGSAGVAIEEVFKTCYACLFRQCPKGWHTWADPEEVRFAIQQGRPDPEGQPCAHRCWVSS